MKFAKINWFFWLIAFMGFFNLWTTLFPLPHYHFFKLLDRMIILSPNHSRPILAISGLSLIYLSFGFIRRQRLAWFLMEIFLIVSAMLQFHHYASISGAAINLILAIWLLRHRRQFYGQVISLSWWRSLGFLALASLLLVTYASLIFWLAAQYFDARYSFVAASKMVLASFWHFRWLGPKLGTARVGWFFNSLPTILGFFLFYSLTLLFSAASYQQERHRQQWQKAFRAIRRYGRSSADFFKLWPANLSFFFWRRSLIAYWPQGANLLVAGDPVGPRNERKNLIHKFLEFSFQHGHNPLFVGLNESNFRLLRQQGFRGIYISDEAFIDLRQRSEDVKDLRNVKIKLGKRRGYSFEVWQPPLKESQIKKLRQVSDAWLKNLNRNDGEAIFGSGWITPMIRSSFTPVIKDKNGKVIAFLSLQRSFRPKTMVIDLMRYKSHLENGAMEYLISKTWDWLGDRNFHWFDLGAAPRAGAVFRMPRFHFRLSRKSISFKAWQQQLRQLPRRSLELHRHLWNNAADLTYFSFLGGFAGSYRGLRHFKNKFQPRWQPRYLAYYNLASLGYVLWSWSRKKTQSVRGEANKSYYYDFLLTHNNPH